MNWIATYLEEYTEAEEYCSQCSAELGWYHKDEAGNHYCPDCARDQRNNLEEELNKLDDEDPAVFILQAQIDQLNLQY